MSWGTNLADMSYIGCYLMARDLRTREFFFGREQPRLGRAAHAYITEAPRDHNVAIAIPLRDRPAHRGAGVRGVKKTMNGTW